VIDRGVIYSITGDKYSSVPFKHWEWCKKSFGSLKLYCPDLHVTLFTESMPKDDPGFDDIVVVDNVIDGKELHPWTFMTFALLRSPYKYTISLDADTKIHSSRILEIYNLLDRFDVVAALTPAVINAVFEGLVVDYFWDDVPIAFSEYQLGFSGHKKNDITNKCWEYMMDSMINVEPSQQRWFRKYAYDHPELKVGPLPVQFNFRSSPVTSGKYYHQTVIEHHHGIWK